jgi:hypothetical protein
MRKFTVSFEKVDHADIPAILQSGMFSEVECFEITHFAEDLQPNPKFISLTNVKAHTNIAEWEKVAGKLTNFPPRIYDRIVSITRNHWL